MAPQLIAQTGAAALFSISEGDLLELSSLPDTIGTCRVLTPRKAKLDVVLDKLKTLDAARSVGILTPESWQPVVGEAMAERAAVLTYPVVLKWSDPPAMFARLDAAGIRFEKAEYAPGTDLRVIDVGDARRASPCRRRRRPVVIVTHSFEMLSRDRQRPNRMVMQRFRAMCAQIAGQPSLTSAGFGALDTGTVLSRTDAAQPLLAADRVRTVGRMIEQAIATVLYERAA